MSGVEAEAEAAANLWLPAGATETHDASETMSVGQARRYRLREFQTQLIERMRAARSGAPQVVNQLGVMIAGQRWLLNLQQAGEVLSPGFVCPVPLTQDWFLGLMNLRGNLIGLSDFARFQGFPLTEIDRASRVIAFSPSLGLQGGIVVSSVLGLRSVASMVAHSPQSPTRAPWAGARYFDRDEQLWTELDLSLLVSDARFLDVGLRC